MLQDFDVNNIKGLSTNEVNERQKNEGFNELPSALKKSTFTIVFEVIREPMFLLLVACGMVYLFLGDIQEALMLLGFVFVVIGITIYQENKTERALEALRDMSSPRALVIRDGEQIRIAGREVVRDDIIIMAEGDRVPADAELLWCVNLSVDESLLTGESVSVRKAASKEITGKTSRPGGDDLPFVYSGTLVVQGQGVAKVCSIGINTEIGKIGKALQTLEPENTLLQKETGRLVKDITLLGLTLCILVVVIYGLTRGHWLEGFLAGLTLAMAMLPEEFPVVLTVFLALGAWRISKKNVLTRRVPAVETLGAATVLCVDKTGTLTQNRMTVTKMFAKGQYYDLNNQSRNELPENFHEIVEFSILASQKDPFDPMERALRQLGDIALCNTEHLHSDWSLIHEYPLSQELLALSHVWKSPNGTDYVIAAKGAPEAIFDLCHLDKARTTELNYNVSEMATEGLRVLGVAKARFNLAALPDGQHDFVFEFVGLVGFADPIRPTVPDAIRECYNAGVRVVMITGDYPGTAQNIARQIGLKPAEDFVTGNELDAMTDEELMDRIKTVNIFARVVPEQKLRLVNALKANGEIVAMTGDGVNDAPALKSANIGIAMGGRGTDVARESASLVILDDDFTSIVQAIRMGRRIFDNIKKAMAYILSIHVPIAGITLIPVMLKWPLVLFPVHIVFLELIIDPACSVVFEAEKEEPNVMKRPPRNPKEPLFNGKTIFLSIMQGVFVLIVMLGIFGYFYITRTQTLGAAQAELEARSMTFVSFIIANIGLILTNRSWTNTILQTLKIPNGALWWVVGGALVFLGIVLYTPGLQHLFRFTLLHPVDLLVCFVAGASSIMWFEILKMLHKPKKQNKKT